MTTPTRPSYEEAESVFETAPKKLLNRLPDSTAKKSALRNLEIVKQYVHEAIERAPRDTTVTLESAPVPSYSGKAS